MKGETTVLVAGDGLNRDILWKCIDVHTLYGDLEPHGHLIFLRRSLAAVSALLSDDVHDAGPWELAEAELV